jgi:hypothetical protein
VEGPGPEHEGGHDCEGNHRCHEGEGPLLAQVPLLSASGHGTSHGLRAQLRRNRRIRKFAIECGDDSAPLGVRHWDTSMFARSLSNALCTSDLAA